LIGVAEVIDGFRAGAFCLVQGWAV
jgi:hypothetical protein